MPNFSSSLQNSWPGRFFNSFSPSSKAVLIFSLPFTLIDALHYYTLGTAMAFSWPVLFLIFLACGFLAARLTLAAGLDDAQARKAGLVSGVKLWCVSTFLNLLVSFLAGTLSLGVTLLLGIPYLLLCAPVLLLLGALTGLVGGWMYTSFHRRAAP